MKNIKDEYKKDLNIFLGIHIVLLYILAFNVDDIKNLYNNEMYKSVFILMLPIFSVVLNGLVPNYIKEFLVFWKFKNRLPGFKAFSVYTKRDGRIDRNVLEEKYPVIKKDNIDENKLWYKIYQKHQEKPSVWDAQKYYLFTRDIATLSIYFIIIAIILQYVFKFNLQNVYIFFLIEYLILIVVSKNYATKFVTNVLALESAS